MKGQKILLTPLRQLGQTKTQSMVDLVFDSSQYRLLAYVAKEGSYLSQDVELHGGVLLASGAPILSSNVMSVEFGERIESEKLIFYSQLLRKHIYDEEGELLGIVGDVEIDLCRKRINSVWLSGGIWEDLCFGRKRLDVVHLSTMQKEWEETV